MGATTAIEWTDATWNPWRGCDKISPGCAHCYMFTAQERYGRDPSVVVRGAPGTFYAPLRSGKWRREAATNALRRSGSQRPLVFTCSWSDWFHEDADPWRDEAWDLIRATPEHTYQILTKRTDRIADHLPATWGAGWPNVWLGTSIENRHFVHRADELRAIPAAVRFISAEPLLGPLLPDADHMVGPEHETYWLGDAPIYAWREWADGWQGGPGLDLTGIDWLIVGGESGPKHRPMDGDWVRDLLEVCQDNAWEHDGREGWTAFFFKQWGGRTPKAGGRELDGRTWDEMPEPSPGADRRSSDRSHTQRLSDGAAK